MLSRKAKYALRALGALAASESGSLPAWQIAERARIPEKFLESILVELRHAGLVRSRRGLAGGHALALPAAAITLGQVIRAIDGPIAPTRCASVTAYQPCSDCPQPARCAIRAVMADVRDATAAVLDHRSLAQLFDAEAI